MSKVIASALITPDGTVLQSYHVHDYKTHVDANGEEYMIDGGTDYCRSNVNKEPAKYISVTMDDPHELRREWFAWGTYGKTGREQLHWKKLKDMETGHIQAILDECNPASHVENLFIDELEYRKEIV